MKKKKTERRIHRNTRSTIDFDNAEEYKKKYAERKEIQ